MEPLTPKVELSQALLQLADSLREARDALDRLEAALDRLAAAKPVHYDANCGRMLARLIRRCDMPVARYLRRF